MHVTKIASTLNIVKCRPFDNFVFLLPFDLKMEFVNHRITELQTGWIHCELWTMKNLRWKVSTKISLIAYHWSNEENHTNRPSWLIIIHIPYATHTKCPKSQFNWSTIVSGHTTKDRTFHIWNCIRWKWCMKYIHTWFNFRWPKYYMDVWLEWFESFQTQLAHCYHVCFQSFNGYPLSENRKASKTIHLEPCNSFGEKFSNIWSMNRESIINV